MKGLAGWLLVASLAGCGPRHASFVKVDQVALGSVVIYRNGVAFYERRATVTGGALTVSVPRDRVDDFLKSLTVVDAATGQALAVSIPRQQSSDGATLEMRLALPTTDTADVVLTYVTEAPAWKPSYRVVVGDHHDVLLEGWAIVDNTSGEDWNQVLVGVGSSSALSFRYDLWSVRQVQRETLANEERFAIAPPTGMSPYSPGRLGDAGGEVVLGELHDDELGIAAGGHAASGTTLTTDYTANVPSPSRTAETIEVQGAAPIIDQGPTRLGAVVSAPAVPNTPAARTAPQLPPQVLRAGDQTMNQAARSILASGRTIVIEGYSNAADAMSNQRNAARVDRVRNQLIDQGVAPARIKVVNKLDPSSPERVRLVAEATPARDFAARGARLIDTDTEPVGESHFASKQPITVARGSSVMVSMVQKQTEGEIVYLYDAESQRGNDKFAFRAVRFKNPTDSTLETGPVTVYGHERFIGEGLTEPIPPAASAVVPYALDRQIVVERKDGEDDRIARLTTLSRGVLTASVQHTRRQTLTVTNRLGEPARLFIRHTVAKGWTLTDAPPAFERVGDAHLFEVDLAAHEVKDIVIAEATPRERSLDLGADSTLAMMKVWIDAPDGTPELKDQLHRLLAIHRTVVDLAQEQDSLRSRLTDYRARMDELHAQIVTLQAVKTSGDLMTHLKAKLTEISNRVQKTTIQIVDQEEKIMLARVQFQDALGELVLPDAMATR